MQKALEAIAKNNRYEYLLVAALVGVSVCSIMIAGGVYPFGDLALARADSLFQYIGFTGWLSNVLNGDGNVGYSFSKALGGGTISLFGFILASPANALSGFFSAEDIPKFFSLLVPIKLMACGVTCLAYIRTRLKVHGPVYVVLAASYATMMTSFMAGSNVMWLDGFILLPLVCLGVYKLLSCGKAALLFLSVACAVLFNWYCGYIVCVYSIIYFIAELVLLGKKRTWLKSGLSYAATMLCALAASMILFFPIIQYMMNSAATTASGSNAVSGELLASPFDLLRYLYFGNASIFDSAANFPVSGIVLLSSLSLLFLGREYRKQKLVFGAVLVFLWFSYAWPPLSLLWSGFVRSDSFTPRFAFTAVFTLVVAGSWAAKGLADIGDRRRKIMILASASALFLVPFLITNVVNPFASQLLFAGQVLSFILFGLTAFVLLSRGFTVSKSIGAIACLLLCLVFVVEQTAMDKRAFSTENNSMMCSVSDYASYIGRLEREQDMLEDGSFFRTEKYSFSSIEDSSVSYPTGEYFSTGMRGLSHYSSATDQPVNTLLGNLGYCLTPGTRAITYYNSPMLATDTIFGVEYIFGQNPPPAGYEKVKDLDDFIYENVALYRNPRALSIGFGVPSDAVSVDWGDDVFVNQSSWVSQLAGQSVDLYASASVDATDPYDNIDTALRSVGLSRDSSSLAFWKIVATEDGPLYLDARASNTAYLFHNGNFLQRIGSWEFDTNVIYLGDYKAGETVELAMAASQPEVVGGSVIRSATLRLDEYSYAVGLLSSRQFETESFGDGYLKGVFTADEKQDVLLTIPLEKGWGILVNSEEVVANEMNGLIRFPVEAGRNEVELRYEIPGLSAGILLSVGGVVVFSIWRSALRARVKRRCTKEGNRG